MYIPPGHWEVALQKWEPLLCKNASKRKRHKEDAEVEAESEMEMGVEVEVEAEVERGKRSR